MKRYEYTQVTFATPQARVKFSEACLENRARDVERIYEGLRQDANDGEFALWTMDDLVVALHELGDEIRELDRARAAMDDARGAEPSTAAEETA